MKIRIEGKINDGLSEAPPLEWDVDDNGTARISGAPLIKADLGDLLVSKLQDDERGGWVGPGYTVQITVLEEEEDDASR